jgi:putative GTP pyrophosphokinase
MQQLFASKLPNKAKFLQALQFTEADFIKSKLDWDDLNKIFEDYQNFKVQLNPTAQFVADSLSSCGAVHAVKKRVKEPSHLIEKIVRKSIEKARRYATSKNYKEKLSDLVGVRGLNVVKEDWLQAHNYITNQWKLVGKPKAFLQEGDAEHVVRLLRKGGCTIAYNKAGYRSVHYDVLIPASKSRFQRVEIQIRTLFEEAWGEVSHRATYPEKRNEAPVVRSLDRLSNTAGLADYLASVIYQLTVFHGRLGKATDAEVREFEKIIGEKFQYLSKCNPELVQACWPGATEVSARKILGLKRKN